VCTSAVGLDPETELHLSWLIELLGGGAADHGREAPPDELGDERRRDGDFDMVVEDVQAGLATEVSLESGGTEFSGEAIAEPARVVWARRAVKRA
jgi:hypothetical protein